MLIEQPHFVHPNDVAVSGTLRGLHADPDDAVHPDYVAMARTWLEQHLIGEYHRLRAEHPGRFTGHEPPVIHDLDEPYTDAHGRTWQLPHAEAGTVYDVGWVGTLQVEENPDWTDPAGA